MLDKFGIGEDQLHGHTEKYEQVKRPAKIIENARVFRILHPEHRQGEITHQDHRNQPELRVEKDLKLALVKGDQIGRYDDDIKIVIMPMDAGPDEKTQDKKTVQDNIYMLPLKKIYGFGLPCQNILVIQSF